MRIVVIGPTYPFRGGIAHYTTLLCQALRQHHQVKFISFKRQYPKLLFPGKSDRDPSKAPLKAGDVDYIIDSINPLSWIAAARLINNYEPDKIVLPWWVAFWMPQFWIIATLVQRRYFKPEVIIICHNVVEHEPSTIKKLATHIMLLKADRLITHCRQEAHVLRNWLGESVNVVTASHPTYAGLSDERYTKEKTGHHLCQIQERRRIP